MFILYTLVRQQCTFFVVETFPEKINSQRQTNADHGRARYSRVQTKSAKKTHVQKKVEKKSVPKVLCLGGANFTWNDCLILNFVCFSFRVLFPLLCRALSFMLLAWSQFGSINYCVIQLCALIFYMRHYHYEINVSNGKTMGVQMLVWLVLVQSVVGWFVVR